MIRGHSIRRAGPGAAALLPALALACAIAAPATAQDAPAGGVGDFSLPPGTTRPSAPVQGPVDDQVPVVRPTRPVPAEPTPAPVETPTATPAPAAPPAARTTSSPAPVRPRAPLTPAVPAAAPSQTEPEAIPPVGTETAAPAAPIAQPTLEATPVPVQSTDDGAGLPGWVYGLLALLAAGGALAWFLRRRGNVDEDDTVYAPIDSVEVEPASAAALPTEPVPAPVAPATPARPTPVVAAPPPAPTPDEPAVGLALEAHHLSRSLIYVTLAYRLTIANHSAAPVGPVRIAGDIASAHASRSREDQLRPAPAELAPCHEIARIEAGESLALTGELRLPVASILAIQQGAAQLFVPLARFMIQAGDGPLSTHVFVVGQSGGEPGGALRPFRMDAMPSVFRQLDQREIAAAA